MARLDPESLPVHVDRLFRAAWALCGSPHDAEDLVQETFLRVLSRPRLLRGDD
jgi:RNA polymerase sigma-70 factor (ECF subfamily)